MFPRSVAPRGLPGVSGVFFFRRAAMDIFRSCLVSSLNLATPSKRSPSWSNDVLQNPSAEAFQEAGKLQGKKKKHL
jgi:hypothetical protein